MTSTVVAPPDPRPAPPTPFLAAAAGAVRRELRRAAALFTAVPHADITVRLRVLAHARECLTVLRAVGAGGAEVGVLVRKAEDLLARFPVFDTTALASVFRALAGAATTPVAAHPTVDDVLHALPRPRRISWLGHLLATVPPADRDAALKQTSLATAWRLAASAASVTRSRSSTPSPPVAARARGACAMSSDPIGQHCDPTDMIVIHRLFRREFRRLPDFVAAAPHADPAGLARIVNHTRELVAGLRHHHEIEDEILWPLLRDRTPLDAAVARMDAQHERLGALLERAATLLESLPGSADELVAVLRQVPPLLEAHLDEEERVVLPLVRAHVTRAEWARLGDRGLDVIPPRRRLVALGHILEDASADERALFLRRAPLPARVLFRLGGERSARREKAALERVLT